MMERDESNYSPRNTSSPLTKPTNILNVSGVNTLEEASTICKSNSRFTRSRTYSLDLLSRGRPQFFGQCSTSKPDNLISSISSKLAILSQNSERSQLNFLPTSGTLSLPCTPVLLADQKSVSSSERKFSHTLTKSNSSIESSCSSDTELVHNRDSAKRLIKNLVTIFQYTKSPSSSARSPLSPLSTEFVDPVVSPLQMASSHSSPAPDLQSTTDVQRAKSTTPGLVHNLDTDSLTVDSTLASGSDLQCLNDSNDLKLLGYNCIPGKSLVTGSHVAEGYLEPDLTQPVSGPEPVVGSMFANTEADHPVDQESTNSESHQNDCSLELLLNDGHRSSFVPNDNVAKNDFSDGNVTKDLVENHSNSLKKPPEATKFLSITNTSGPPPPNSVSLDLSIPASSRTCDQPLLISDVTNSHALLANAHHCANENTHINCINHSNSKVVTEEIEQSVQQKQTLSPLLTMVSKKKVQLVETQGWFFNFNGFVV